MPPRDKEKQKLYNQYYYQKHRNNLISKAKERVSRWQRDNKEHRSKKAKLAVRMGVSKNKQYNKNARIKLKREVVEAYGGVCSCCGEVEMEFMTLDHVNGDGASDRAARSGGGSSWRSAKLRGFPSDLRLLCFNCNISAYRGGGICVHKRKSVDVIDDPTIARQRPHVRRKESNNAA